MNYRKWPVQSVWWIVASILLFANLIAIDLYHWKVQGKPFHFYRFVDDLPFSLAAGWSMTLSEKAKGIGFLTWLLSVILTITGISQAEKVVFLSPSADDACTSASALIPIFVAVGVVLLWQRRERMREIRTIQ